MKISHVSETDLVQIAPIALADVSDAYVAWLNDPEVNRYLMPGSRHSRESVRAYVESTLADPNSCMWKILLKEGSAAPRHVGNIKLTTIKWQHRNASIGFLVGDKAVWGRGIATDAIRLVTRFAFSELKMHKLYAAIVEENVGSKKSLMRAGYRVEAYLNQDGFIEGRLIDSLWLSIFNDSANGK